MSQRNPEVRYFTLDQGGAGSTVLAAGVATKRICLKSLVFTMSAGGSAQLRTNANPLSGAMPIASNGGLVIPPVKDETWAETVAGEDLRIFTVTGLAKGFGSYTVE